MEYIHVLNLIYALINHAKFYTINPLRNGGVFARPCKQSRVTFHRSTAEIRAKKIKQCSLSPQKADLLPFVKPGVKREEGWEFSRDYKVPDDMSQMLQGLVVCQRERPGVGVTSRRFSREKLRFRTHRSRKLRSSVELKFQKSADRLTGLLK